MSYLSNDPRIPISDRQALGPYNMSYLSNDPRIPISDRQGIGP